MKGQVVRFLIGGSIAGDGRSATPRRASLEVTEVRCRHRGLSPARPQHGLPTADRRGDGGFTLVELLIAVSVMALLVGAIATGIITILRNQSGAANRFSDSSNANLTSAIYVRDVQSAALITTAQSPLHTPTTCGAGGPNMVFKLGLAWSTPSSGASVVSYLNNTGTNTLVRQYCASAPVPCTPPASVCLQSTVTVARGLSSNSILVAIAPSADSTAATTDWISSVGTSSVTLSAQESASAYHFDLLASPRLSTPQSLGVSPGGSPFPPPLFLLGQTAPSLTCSGSSQSKIIVNGAAFLDSTANGAGQISGGSSFSATQIYTADPNPSGAITGNYAPKPPIYASAESDPYAGLTPPSTTGLNVYSDGAYHGPGVYTNTLTLSGQSSTTFAAGIYILQNGISVSGGANISNAPGGVLLYVSAGTITLAGSGTVTLTPMASPYSFLTAPNLGIWQADAMIAPNLGIWQAASDTNPISLSGNGSGNTFSGAVYAPTAMVGSAGNGNFTADSIIASGLTCAGNGTETIGG